MLLIKRCLTSLDHIQNFVAHSLEQITTRSTRIADQTATLVDHILTNSPDKVSQSGIIDLGLSDRDLMYCTRKKSLHKSHKHKEIFLEKVFHRKVFGDLKMDHFPKLSDLHLCKCCLLRFYIQIFRSKKFHSPSKKEQSEG